MIIDDLFPEKGKLVLTANGKEFIERLGVETARQVILAVLRGENIRTQTEPLTRRRVAIATGAMVYFLQKDGRKSITSQKTYPLSLLNKWTIRPNQRKIHSGRRSGLLV